MNDFPGRVAIVTGAASPIGRAIANLLAQEGCKLVLADITSEAVSDVAAVLDGKAVAVSGDLSRDDVAQHLVQTALDHFGRVDILVNNAGGGVLLPFLEHDVSTLQTTLNRNLWTTLLCCRHTLPVMVANNYGRIINLGADSVRNGLLLHAAYNAAKGGVHGLTTGLAREFAEYDITVNTVAPCIVHTPAVDQAIAEGNPLVHEYLSVVPKGRAAGVDEIAHMVAHLATSKSAFVTGQVISVNGGSTML